MSINVSVPKDELDSMLDKPYTEGEYVYVDVTKQFYLVSKIFDTYVRLIPTDDEKYMIPLKKKKSSIKETKQKAWLGKIKDMEITGFPFKLCLSHEGHPGKWVDWKDWDWKKHSLAEYRTLLMNELVFDLDVDDKIELYFTATRLINKLESEGVPHYIYDSGGKGYHIQVFLKAPETVDWRKLRVNVARYLTKGIMERCKKGGHTHWNIDPRKVNWSNDGMGSVVRAVGGKKLFTKQYIKEILPANQRKRRSRPVFTDVDFEYWEVPKHIIQSSTPDTDRERTFDMDEFLSDSMVPLCIEKLVEEEQEGVHLNHQQRIAVVSHLWKRWKSMNPDVKMCSKDIDEIVKIFVNDPDFNENITRYQINHVIDNLEMMPEKMMGCGYMQENKLIDDELCVLCKEMKRGGLL